MDAHALLGPALYQVTTRAAVDAAFRAWLLRDPLPAIHAATGIALPPATRLRCLEAPDGVDVLVVLDPPAAAPGDVISAPRDS